MVKVIITSTAAIQLEALPRVIQARMLGLVERLRKWPEVSGVKPLRGSLVGCYRMRTGDYRLQFRVDGNTVKIEKIGHRDKFYED
jgi:mRNA-degrading endonuclease RelE of RelBE toxin-antitoxin system